MKAPVTYAVFLLVVALVAASGALFTPGEWYAALARPDWTPPDWLFPPVWSALYVMIALAGARTWLRTSPGERAWPFTAYGGQLVLNAGWSALFFGAHMPALALAELVLLWLAILATMSAFRRHDRAAAWLLLPYLAWVTFAGALNAAIVWLN